MGGGSSECSVHISHLSQLRSGGMQYEAGLTVLGMWIKPRCYSGFPLNVNARRSRHITSRNIKRRSSHLLYFKAVKLLTWIQTWLSTFTGVLCYLGRSCWKKTGAVCQYGLSVQHDISLWLHQSLFIVERLSSHVLETVPIWSLFCSAALVCAIRHTVLNVRPHSHTAATRGDVGSRVRCWAIHTSGQQWNYYPLITEKYVPG